MPVTLDLYLGSVRVLVTRLTPSSLYFDASHLVLNLLRPLVLALFYSFRMVFLAL